MPLGPVILMLEFEYGLDLGPLTDEMGPGLEAAMSAADPAMVLGVWAAMFSSTDEELNAGIEAALTSLDAPCLSLHGSAPADGYAGWLTTHAPVAEVEVWKGMGHFLHLVDPVRFAERVRAWVAGVR